MMHHEKSTVPVMQTEKEIEEEAGKQGKREKEIEMVGKFNTSITSYQSSIFRITTLKQDFDSQPEILC